MQIGSRQSRRSFARPGFAPSAIEGGQAGYSGILYRLALLSLPRPLPILGVAVMFYLF
jgi:hypothetical protein